METASQSLCCISFVPFLPMGFPTLGAPPIPLTFKSLMHWAGQLVVSQNYIDRLRLFWMPNVTRLTVNLKALWHPQPIKLDQQNSGQKQSVNFMPPAHQMRE